MTRRYTSAADIKELLRRQKHCCCGLPHHPCGVKFSKRNPYRIDHVIPVSPECGGTDDLPNKQLLCERCHDIKTRGARALGTSKLLTTAGSDIGAIRKLRKRRLRAQASRPRRRWPAGRKLQSRPFQKHPELRT